MKTRVGVACATLLTCWAILLAVPTFSGASSIAISTNQTIYQPGDPVALTLLLSPTLLPTPQPALNRGDLYVQVTLPDGSILFLDQNAQFTSATRPFRPDLTVAAPSETEIFSFQFAPVLPQGTYTLLAFQAKTGSDPTNPANLISTGFPVRVAFITPTSCTLSPITPGRTVIGSLASTDCAARNRTGSLADLYTFDGTAGQVVSLRLRGGFDTFLLLLGPGNAFLFSNDDCPGDGLNSCIPTTAPGGGTFTLPSTGTYMIEATSFASGAPGTYTLTLSGGVTPPPPPPGTFLLPVSVFGSGTGSVTSNQGGINCATGTVGTCTAIVTSGTSVTLKATPTGGAAFIRWGGDCAGAGTAATCTLALNADKVVTATFNPLQNTFSLTVVSVLGSGPGTVTSNQGGINCATGNTGTCVAIVTIGTPVTLTATPTGGATFGGWGGNCTGFGLALTCTLVPITDKSVRATFSQTTGGVTVTVQVPVNRQTFPAIAGITITQGQPLTITATGSACFDTACNPPASPQGSGRGPGEANFKLPGAPQQGLVCGIGGQSPSDLFFVGSSFSGQATRSGSLFCGMNEEDVPDVWPDNSGSWTVTITIGGIPGITFPLTVSVLGSGTGSVTSSPGGINCATGNSGTCTASFTSTTPVTLMATPTGGATFGGWDGDCAAAGTAATCTLSMTTARLVRATFSQTTGGVTVTVQVPVNRQTFPAIAGITITQGQPLTITATGSACFDTACNPPASPQGSGRGPGEANFKLPGAPQQGLVCGIGGQSPSDLFFVGSSFSGQATRSGSLFCGMNEEDVPDVWPDNSGSWTVTITIGGIPGILFLSVLGSGTGTVTSNQGGINCATGNTGTCVAFVTIGTPVTLTATPTGGATFGGWGGNCTGFGLALRCTLVPITAKSVTATFNTPPPSPLSVIVRAADTGNPIAGATVAVKGTPLRNVTTPGIFSSDIPAGGAAFPDVPVGPQTVTVSAARFAPATVPVTIQAGQTTGVTISLVREAAFGTLTGIVVSAVPPRFTGTATAAGEASSRLAAQASNKQSVRIGPDVLDPALPSCIPPNATPIPGATVSLQILGAPIEATTQANGTFFIAQAQAGTVLVAVRAAGQNPTTQLATIEQDLENCIVVTLLPTLNPDAPTIGVTLNAGSFRRGQMLTLNLSLTLGASASPTQADEYLLAVLPDGQTVLSLVANPVGPPSVPVGVVPYRPNVAVTPGVEHIMDYTFSGGEAPGKYQVLGRLVKPGANPLNPADWLSTTTTSFDFGP